MVLAGLMWTKMFSGGLMCVKIEVRSRHFAKKKIHTGSGSWVTSRPKPKTKINLCSDLEFNSIHYGLEINKRLTFLILKNFRV